MFDFSVFDKLDSPSLTTVVKLDHPEKKLEEPIDVTEFGIVTVKLVQ